jgi:hypothetical protein
MRKLKRSPSLTKSYGPIVIWADQAEEILEALKVCQRARLVADDVEYDSIDEFVKESKGNRPKNFAISSEKPYVDVEFGFFGAKLKASAYRDEDELPAHGLFQKIDAILTPFQRRPLFLFKFRYTVLLLAVMSGMTYMQLPERVMKLDNLAIPFVLAWLLYLNFISMAGSAVVYPVRKIDAHGFFRRNKDQLYLALISAIAGAVLGVAATKLADKLSDTAPPSPVASAPAKTK